MIQTGLALPEAQYREQCKILYLNMSHPLLLFLLSVDACLRQGWLGVLSWKRAVNKEYLEEKQLLTCLF